MEEYKPLIRDRANRAYVTCKNTKNTSSHSNAYSHSQITMRQNGKRPNRISEIEYSTHYRNVIVHHRATNHTHIREQIIQHFLKSDPKSQKVIQFELNKKTPNWSVNGTSFEPTEEQHEIGDGKQVEEEATDHNQYGGRRCEGDKAKGVQHGGPRFVGWACLKLLRPEKASLGQQEANQRG